VIRYGILGVGHLGRFHALQAKEIESCKLSSIYDLSPERLAEVSKEIAIDKASSIDNFLDSVDAFSLVTTTSSHYELAKKAILKGKHILIEKPITTTVEEANELIDLAKKHNVLLQVGHIERFNNALLAIKDIDLKPLFIESHRLAPFKIRGTDVAVVLDLMIHDIDLILSLVKSDVISIHATGIPIISESEDIVNCRLEFKNGCIANITASRISANAMRKMRIFQRESYLSLDFQNGSADVYYIENDKMKDLNGDFALSLGEIEQSTVKKEIKYAKFQKNELNPLREEIKSFINAIEFNNNVLVTAEDGRNALLIAEKILTQLSEYQMRIGLK
jgi:predicted dehydrogenase